MAFGACQRCGEQLGASRICPKCGAIKKQRKSIYIALVLVQLAALGYYVKIRDAPKIPTQHSTDLSFLANQTAGGGWMYYDTTDELVFDTTRHARMLSSANSGASNPNDAGTTGSIELRSSPKYGKSVVLIIKRKAFDGEAETAVVHAKFDNEPVVDFAADETTSAENAMLSIKDYDGFVAQVKNANSAVFDAQLAKNTQRVLKFTLVGLKW